MAQLNYEYKVKAQWFLVNFNKKTFAVLAFKIGREFDSTVYQFKKGDGLRAFIKIAKPKVVYVGDFKRGVPGPKAA